MAGAIVADVPAVTDDVCDIKKLYEGFSYSLPQSVLESWIGGASFGREEPYTPEERADLEADIRDLFASVVPEKPLSGAQTAFISAGPPGAGKTTLLTQRRLEEKKEGGEFLPFVSPDAVCLKGQTRTYVKDVSEGDGSVESRNEAYTKWRPGSNAATHILLANLIKRKSPFFFESTCSSDKTHFLLAQLKEQGYSIHLIHVSASDDVRWESIQERDKTFIQTTKEDVENKGLDVPQRITDTFLKYADKISFYARSKADADATLAATWLRTDEGIGKLSVTDEDAYSLVKEVHDAAIETIGRPDLSWENTVEKHSKVE